MGRATALVLTVVTIGCGRLHFDPLGDGGGSTGDGAGDGAPADAALATLAQTTYIKASNTDLGDAFGESVALSADGSTLIVGTDTEASNAQGVNGNQADNSAVRAGAVYVFVRAGSTWTQQAYLKASNAEANDFFGVSIGISSDGSTVVVGAPGEASNATGVGGNQANNSAGNAGAAYVFVRTGVTWTQQAYLKASNTFSNSEFGITVTCAGDGSRVAVGARYALNGGGAYVFARAGAIWSAEASPLPAIRGLSDEYGESVSLSSDGATLAVGAFRESGASTGINGDATNLTATGAGAVYVFVRSGTVWSQQAYVKASNTGASDGLGAHVRLSADGSTLAASATAEQSAATGVDGDQSSNAAPGAGAVYVYRRTGATWNQEAYVKASNTEPSDFYGAGLAISGDGSTLVVGAPDEDSNARNIGGAQADNSAFDSGAAYLYSRSGTTWSQLAYIKASNSQGNFFFGSSALSSDASTLALGAIGDSSAATGINGDQTDTSAGASGAVYVFQ